MPESVSSAAQFISLRGVRVHNLKNVDVDIPRGQLVAICGVSGSGKTSLALDTLYAEGQRRYIESFSAYTRQFLERIEKPDYDSIEGLTPALAVTRTSAPRGSRSTVGTASEILDYLRLFVTHIGKLNCYQCGRAILSSTPQSVARFIEAIPQQRKLMLAFETGWDDVGERASILADLQHQGFVRLLASNQILMLGHADRDELADLVPTSGQIWVIADRLKGGSPAERSSESLESAFEHGNGSIGLFVERDTEIVNSPSFEYSLDGVDIPAVDYGIDGREWELANFSSQRKCSNCDIEFFDPEPRLFSFNSPLGACSQCEGFGDTIDLDWDSIFPDRKLTVRGGAVAPWNSPAYEHHLDELVDSAEALGIPLDVPLGKLTKKQMQLLKAGDSQGIFGGVEGFFQSLDRKKYKMHVRVFLSRWRAYNRCTACEGSRLSPQALSYHVDGSNIAQLCEMKVSDLRQFLTNIELRDIEQSVASELLNQIDSRLGYLEGVGLGYLQLNRPLRTLSGGETQRTALTAALGSSLVNMLYVLDEPSAGLHPHDIGQLAESIERLSDRGNTVVIVEHEEALLEKASTLVEVGPLAGKEGGTIVFNGPRQDITSAESLTGDYLAGRRTVPIPLQRREAKRSIRLRGCSGHNLQRIDVEFPLGLLCVVTGVSGSGKSTLVRDTLFPALQSELTGKSHKALSYKSIAGVRQVQDCVLVDQLPVSKSPRSNPVTYVKAFDEIRAAFADTVDARSRNLTAGHFSFNSELGRCSTCNGDGVLNVDMQFLADVQMTCHACRGSRYRSELLSVKLRDLSIADVLRLTVSEAIKFFRGASRVQQKLQVLVDVGLGYVQLGQSSTTLSTGEAQRLKLAGFLASATRKKTLFLIDEPTTGLHFHDIVRLLDCFDALIEGGHSLVVIEHNINLIAAADFVIDLGPGAADAGGRVVACGSPEQVAACATSLTGRYLSSKLLANRD